MGKELHTLVRDENHLRQLIGAAINGDGEACYWIGHYYSMEVYKLKKDDSGNNEVRISELEEKEFEYIMKGANLPSPKMNNCQEMLADYYSDRGNKAEALKWLRQAVSNGNDSTFWLEALTKEVEGDAKATQRSLPSTNKSEGCYIATAVYGSYDCPEVWTLRSFRDNSLATTWCGRVFIKFYYATSPNLVKLFGNNPKVKAFIKQKLDKFVILLIDLGI